MAGEVLLTPMLLGLGVDELSMGSVFIPRIKRAVQRLSYAEMKVLVEDLEKRNTGQVVLERLEEVARAHYPELLE
jgi:phosphotransferase system enzyme I (PtsI)